MYFYKQNLLQSSQLKRLSDHKYSCQNISVLGGFYTLFSVCKIMSNERFPMRSIEKSAKM